MFEIGYAGNHAVHVVAGSYDLNQLPDQYLSLGNALQNSVPNPYAGVVPGALGAATITQAQALKPFPYYSSITRDRPTLGDSIYHAGFLSVQKRLSHGLVLLGVLYQIEADQRQHLRSGELRPGGADDHGRLSGRSLQPPRWSVRSIPPTSRSAW